MAFKGQKRSASKAAGGALKKAKTGGVAKKCRAIANAIRAQENLPRPVRSMLCDTLVRTFATYKDERHPLQVNISDLVGNVLKGAQSNFQAGIREAQDKKGGLEATLAALSQVSDSASADSDAAATALANSKAAVSDRKAALKDAKSALHDLETAVKTSAADIVATAAKKEKLEALNADFIVPIKEGGKHGAAAGRHVEKEVGSKVEPEFLVCVGRTYSKAASTWGTFDGIVEKKLAALLTGVAAELTVELEAMAVAATARAANIESTKAAIAGAEQEVKNMEEACTGAAAAAKEADAAAKTAIAKVKQQQHDVQKAADSCAQAEGALTAFTNGALAAYTEVEAHAAPPPEPEPVVEAEAPAPLAEAMTAAPPQATRPSPTILPSPGVLLSRAAQGMAQAVGLAPSPRVASSPRA